MAEPNAKDETPKAATEPAPAPSPTDGLELTDEQLDKVAGGLGFESTSNVLETRHDTAKSSISNIR